MRRRLEIWPGRPEVADIMNGVLRLSSSNDAEETLRRLRLFCPTAVRQAALARSIIDRDNAEQ
jgi:hypothetical protein